MNKNAWLLLPLLMLAGCFAQPKEQIQHRWDFTGVAMPNPQGFLDSIANGPDEVKEAMEDFFRGNELLLRKDNSFDMVVFKRYLHGQWKFNEATNKLTLTAEGVKPQAIIMQVDSVDGQYLQLTLNRDNFSKLVPPFQYSTTGYYSLLQNSQCTFYLVRDKDIYWQEEKDPYSKPNNLWRMPPAQPETDVQIAKRVEQHVKFCRLMMQDALDNKKELISFNWIVTPLVLSNQGCALRSFDGTKEGWTSNFYDTTQAFAGYQLLEAAIKKGVKPVEGNTRFENFVVMLDQVLANLKK